jgi:hypothetical protein
VAFENFFTVQEATAGAERHINGGATFDAGNLHARICEGETQMAELLDQSRRAARRGRLPTSRRASPGRAPIRPQRHGSTQ